MKSLSTYILEKKKKTIVLLSCVKTKEDHKCQAKDLYISPLFKKSYKYAQSLNPDKILILSAKHYVINTTDVIGPYNLTLNDMDADDKKEWTNKVLDKLKGMADIDNDEFIILCGNDYHQYLLDHLKHHKIPMKNCKGLGYQLEWLDDHN